MKKTVNSFAEKIGSLVNAYKTWAHLTKQALPDMTQAKITLPSAPAETAKTEAASETTQPDACPGQESQQINSDSQPASKETCLPEKFAHQPPNQQARSGNPVAPELEHMATQRNLVQTQEAGEDNEKSLIELEEARQRRRQENAERAGVFEERMAEVIQANADRAAQRKKEIEGLVQQNEISIARLEAERQRIRQMNLDKIQARLAEITGSLKTIHETINSFEAERARLEARLSGFTTVSGQAQEELESIRARKAQIETRIQENGMRLTQLELEKTSLEKPNPDQMSERLAEIEKVISTMLLGAEGIGDERENVVRASTSHSREHAPEHMLSMDDYDKYKQEQRSIAQKEADRHQQIVDEQRMRILERKTQIAEANRRRAAEIEAQRERILASRQGQRPGF